MTPTEAVAVRVRELRGKRGWSAQRLADEMAKAGFTWERMVVTKLENGRRANVSVEELLALAYVLDVAPIHLLVPTMPKHYRVVPNPRPDPSGRTREMVDAADVRRWICGEQPLPETDLRIYFSEVDEETFRRRFGHGSNWTPPTEVGAEDAS